MLPAIFLFFFPAGRGFFAGGGGALGGVGTPGGAALLVCSGQRTGPFVY
jgi:hypothetical protein